jgi:hypothetical protein
MGDTSLSQLAPEFEEGEVACLLATSEKFGRHARCHLFKTKRNSINFPFATRACRSILTSATLFYEI